MSQLLFANNATSNLIAPVMASDTTCQLTPGTGQLFPNPNVNQSFNVTFIDAATRQLREIVNVTSIVGDTFVTMTRGLEGTTAQSWLVGDIVQSLVTAGTLASFMQSLQYVGARIVTNSGGFTMNASDHTIGLARTVAPAASFSTLPAPGLLSGDQEFYITDLTGNFQPYPVTLYAPSSCYLNGAASVVLSGNFGSYHVRYFGDNRTYSVTGKGL